MPGYHFVLDNSGSMIKNDPDFLARKVVTDFLSGFRGECRIGMVIFDKEARLVEPLMEMRDPRTRTRFMKSLEAVNYKGLFSDTPAAIERAIYELKINGRKDAQKIIILLTDGIVDTGDKIRDLERENWLKESLTQLSKKANIRIFGIALRIRLISDSFRHWPFKQTASTPGRIVLRISRSFLKRSMNWPVNCRQTRRNGPGGNTRRICPQTTETSSTVVPVEKQAAPVAPSPPAVEPVASPAPKPVPVQIPAQKTNVTSHLILTGVIALLVIAILAILFVRRSRTFVATDGVDGPEKLLSRKTPEMPRAELIDVKNITGEKTFLLNKRIMKIGRNSLNDIPIPMETVSSFHATIEYRDGFFYLEDQRSMNKTLLNGKEVKSSFPVKLKSGDEITFNIYRFLFILPDLIPAGETVMDFKSKPREAAVEETIIHSPDPALKEAAELPQAMLIDVKNITKRKTFLLDKRITKIGRDVNNEITIPEDTVSSLHSTIEHRDGFFYLEDQRSKNKTFLNGEEIEAFTPKKLKSGDEIMINVYKFIFLLERQFPTGETGERP